MLLAEFQGEDIFPADLPNGIAKKNTCGPTDGPAPHCPECGEQVTHRDQGANGKVAHFAHCPQSYGGCPGSTVGESAEHGAMKSIAVGVVEDRLSVPVSESGTEQQVPAPYSDKEHRTADGLIRFDSRDEQLGDGLAIEVQYRNKQKDVEATTLDYIRADEPVAVLWLWEDDFDTAADSPEDWTLPLGGAADIRERVRKQLWPSGAGSAIWRSVQQTADRRADPPIPRQAGVRRPDVGHAEVRISECRPSEPSVECPVTFPPQVVDDLAQSYKEEQDWSSLFTATHAQKYINEVHDHFELPAWRVPVSVPKPEMRNLIKRRSVEAAKARHEGHGQTPDPPPTPFDDMQCWNCGHYWYAYESSPRLQCRNCGTPVDVKWNYNTGRISEVPFLPEYERLQPGAVAITDGGDADE